MSIEESERDKTEAVGVSAAAATLRPREPTAGSSFAKTAFAYMRLAMRRRPRKINTAPAKESAPGISAKKIAPHVAAKTT